MSQSQRNGKSVTYSAYLQFFVGFQNCTLSRKLLPLSSYMFSYSFHSIFFSVSIKLSQEKLQPFSLPRRERMQSELWTKWNLNAKFYTCFDIPWNSFNIGPSYVAKFNAQHCHTLLLSVISDFAIVVLITSKYIWSWANTTTKCVSSETVYHQQCTISTTATQLQKEGDK